MQPRQDSTILIRAVGVHDVVKWVVCWKTNGGWTARSRDCLGASYRTDLDGGDASQAVPHVIASAVLARHVSAARSVLGSAARPDRPDLGTERLSR